VRLAFLDIESTGLYLDQGHQIWDLAVIIREPGLSDAEHQWFVAPDLSRADPMALRIGRYYERTAGLLPPKSRKQGPKWSDPAEAAARVARLLDGAMIIGAVPSFDVPFAREFLRGHGHCLTSHYHLQDVETLVLGWLHGQRFAGEPVKIPDWPLSSDVLSMCAGVRPEDFDRHTAIGDCRWVRAQFDAVTRTAPLTGAA